MKAHDYLPLCSANNNQDSTMRQDLTEPLGLVSVYHILVISDLYLYPSPGDPPKIPKEF